MLDQSSSCQKHYQHIALFLFLNWTITGFTIIVNQHLQTNGRLVFWAQFRWLNGLKSKSGRKQIPTKFTFYFTILQFYNKLLSYGHKYFTFSWASASLLQSIIVINPVLFSHPKRIPHLRWRNRMDITDVWSFHSWSWLEWVLLPERTERWSCQLDS